MSLLDVTDLRVTLQTARGPADALRGVSFSLARGDTVGLIGESGCGKSITALALMGLLPDGATTSGSIRFDGQELTTLPEAQLCRLRGDRIGMVFQEPMTALNPLHTVGRQIAESLRLHKGLSGAAARAEALRLLERVQLPQAAQRLDAYPHQLSGGQRQRVVIAIALACGPDLLIADEPTTALDVTIQREVLDLIAELVREDGMGLLLISHDLGVMADTVQRMLVMYGGTVVESGPTAEVFRRLAHPYSRGLFAARPRLGLARGTRLATIPGRVPELPDMPAGCPFADRCPLVVDDCRARPAAGAVGDPRARCALHPLGRGMTTLLHAIDLHKQYRLPRETLFGARPVVQALDGVGFTLQRGRSLGLVGESGSGKSTLARLVMALEAPTTGQVLFDGQDLHTLDAAALRRARAGFQMVFQDPYGSLDPRRTVLQTVAEPLAVLHGAAVAEQRERAGEALDAVGLRSADLDKYPHEFSGGQRQRIAIARALITRPKLIVADEPVSALDVSVQAQVLNLMQDLQDRFEVTYLFISHDLAVVDLVCDEVIVLQHGRIVEQGHPDQLFRHPQHPYTQRLLAAVPGSALHRA